jgi:adenine-specific DNA-methyltransferase
MAIADSIDARARPGPTAPPGFTPDVARSHGDPGAENAVIHAENLEAMRRLACAGFAGRFRCVYFDPPFNSGRRFVEYEDALDPEAWRAMMLDRIAAARALLADDGSLVVEIDDTELGPLLVATDSVFGRAQRVSTITVVRSAATGHKAINRGPVNVADYLLVYAKDRARWRCNPLVRERDGYDPAYTTWLLNPAEAPERWTFWPLKKRVREALGRAPSSDDVTRFALANAAHVVRFAQPRYEAVSREARALVDRSRREPERVFHLERPGRRPFIVRGGNRVLFLAHKVIESDGRPALVEPLTNVWDDVGFQGIAREGGARFVRSKKPERLMARILAMTTDPGDWVLDAFLGSGTTAAVALKMARRWVGIERGAHVDTLALPRLAAVVDGRDPTGVSRSSAWKGGGGFHVWT